MGNIHRIHPIPDLESAAAGSPVPHPATTLLPFSSSSSSEKDDPSTATTPPLPPHHNHFRRRLLISLIVLSLLIGLFAAAFFLVFHPKLPVYSITGLHVTNLTASIVNVTARNPNERIGIYYEAGSRLSVRYRNTTDLFRGYLPVFYQGHQNTTVIAVALSSMNPNASAIAQEALVIEGRMRVRLKLGKVKIGKRVRIKVSCEVVVDSLRSSHDKILIKSSTCKTHL